MALGPVTAQELGASLQRATAVSIKMGRTYNWAPALGAQDAWARAAQDGDPLALTITEADSHSALLVQSSLEHAGAAAHYISRSSPFVPHSIARTAIEHGLRAMHYMDDRATELERAARRLNEWLYALQESAWLRKGIVAAGHEGAEELPDERPMLDRILARANALGLESKQTKQWWTVGPEPRASTMSIAERYLGSEGAQGVVSMVMRGHAGMDHGVETALLGMTEPGSTAPILERP